MTAGKPQLTTVSIGGTTVDAYLVGWSMDMRLEGSEIRNVGISLSKGVSAVITVDETLNGAAVIIKRGVSAATEQTVFQGEVVNASPDGGLLKLFCADKLYQTTKRLVTASFDKDIDDEAGKYSEIFLTLINDYTGLTATSASVQDSGTDNVLTKFVCRTVSVFDRLKLLADTLGWQFYYNPSDDLVYFEPKGYSSQTTSLATGSNIAEIPIWHYNSDQLFNVIELRGAMQEVETTESGQIGVTSGFTTSQAPFDHIPVSVKVYCDSASPPTTLRTGGISGSTTPYDYEVDHENKKLTWHTDEYTPGDAHYVQLEYSYMLPIPIIMKNQASIDAYGEKHHIIHRTDLLNMDDAETYVTEYLTSHKDPLTTANIVVNNVTDLEIGQTVSVTDSFNSITGNFIVTGIKKKHPYRYDEVEVVNNVLDENGLSWELKQRIKRIEEQQSKDTDLLLHVIAMFRTYDLSRSSFELQKRTITSARVYGHSTFSKFGSGGQAFGATSVSAWNSEYTWP